MSGPLGEELSKQASSLESCVIEPGVCGLYNEAVRRVMSFLLAWGRLVEKHMTLT